MQRTHPKAISVVRRPRGHRGTEERSVDPVLPFGWLFWIAENRLDGITDEQILAIVTSAGFDPQVVNSALDDLKNNPCFAVANSFAQRFRKLKSIEDARKSAAGVAWGAGSIERRSGISRQEFQDRYYAANKPVILTGLIEGGPACRRWTPQYIAESCGEVAAQVMQGRHTDPRYELNSEAHKKSIKLAEYVTMVLEGGPSNDYYLVANNAFFTLPETQKLLAEAPALEDYLNPADRRGKVFFWFGPAGTVTPLHHDIMNILVAEIYGRKRFTLIRPEETAYVYNNIGVYSEVDCQNPDYSRHPLFRYANPISVVIGPGDVLFIPVGWWHHVEALDTSIMVSSINFRFPNQYEWSHPAIY